jgi:hypothetical protein
MKSVQSIQTLYDDQNKLYYVITRYVDDDLKIIKVYNQYKIFLKKIEYKGNF